MKTLSVAAQTRLAAILAAHAARLDRICGMADSPVSWWSNNPPRDRKVTTRRPNPANRAWPATECAATLRKLEKEFAALRKVLKNEIGQEWYECPKEAAINARLLAYGKARGLVDLS